MMDLLLRDYLINLFYLFFLLLWPDDKFNQSATIQGHPTTIFGKTSVRKTIWDLEFSEHLL